MRIPSWSAGAESLSPATVTTATRPGWFVPNLKVSPGCHRPVKEGLDVTQIAHAHHCRDPVDDVAALPFVSQAPASL